MSAEFGGIRTVEGIDWTRWEAVDRATLVFAMRGEEILLIEKKRGLGAGKVNGPGGKVDPGETVEQCAIREVHEELGLEVRNLEGLGEHRFQFVDGYSIHCWVYRTFDFEGEAVETDEAVPLWTPTDAIPYERMWEDDHIWLPMLMAGTAFSARWVFDDDRMLDYVFDTPAEVAA